MTNIFQYLQNKVKAKRKRKTIGKFFAANEIIKIEWRPPDESPLKVGRSTVTLPVDSIITPRTLAYGHWHDEHTRLIRELVKKNPTRKHLLVDVGANLGLVTRQLLGPMPEAWRGGICFEPEANNVQSLRHNVAPLPGVTVVAKGLSNINGAAPLYVDLGNSGDCSLHALPDGINRSGIDEQMIELISTEDAFNMIMQSKQDADRIVWKSDTQGHDLKIISSMPSSFWNQVDVAMIEVRSSTSDNAEIERFLDIAATYKYRYSVKRTPAPVSMQELASFCRLKSPSEFDLLLHN